MAPVYASNLKAEDFASYPPLARALAQTHLDTLRSLPLIFAAVLLREASHYDWQFPAERAATEEQLALLGDTAKEPWKSSMQNFAALPLTPELQAMPWAAQPERFIEKVTAYLWTVHAMDAFHDAATRYGADLSQVQSQGVQAKVAEPSRLCIVLVGRDAPATDLPLFARLRPYGTSFSQVQPGGGLAVALRVLRERAAAQAAPYAHWFLSGAEAEAIPGVSTVSWQAVAPMRRQLLATMNKARNSGTVGPEDLRSLMAQIRPEQIGSSSEQPDALLRRFELSLLTEGSGTQIFSTTFVQWAAREALRRARPQTLVVRYASRQADRPMNDLLASDAGEAQLDPRGSLVDAEMGAFYTWINLTRLPGAEHARFIALHESGSQAIAVSPAMAAKAASTQRCTLDQILRWSEA